MRKRLMVVLLMAGFFSILTMGDSCIAAEETFPIKPIQFWVGFGAGGGTDTTGRALVEATSKNFAQPFVVTNKPGGGGAVMTAELKTAKPDGYTVGILTASALISAHMRKVPYHPVRDFDSILQYASYQYGVVVRTDSPWKTLNDLIAYAKANPGKVSYSTAGAGTPQHLVMVQLGEVLKVKWTHVPFGSGVEATTALMGGHVDFSAGTPEWKPQVDAGRLRLIAVQMDKRIPAYPNVPTFIELGYNLVAPSIASILGPKGIPKERVKILHDAFYKGIQDPLFKNTLDKYDMPLTYRNSEGCDKFVNELFESTGKLVEKL